MYVHVYTMYVHGITSCLNRFSWPTERCRCRSEGHSLAVCCGLRLLSSYCTGTQWSTGKWTLHIHCIYFVYTCCRHVCTNHIQLCTLYIHVHVVDICNHVLPRWTQEQLKKVIAMLQDPAFDSKEIDPDLHKRMDKAAMCMRWTSGCGRSVSWKDWCPLMHRTIWMWAVPVQKMVIGLCQARCCRNRRGHQHWFNSFGIITGIYAYNTWYPCTVYVHVYTLYVHV